jgi:PEP-CTERM motif
MHNALTSIANRAALVLALACPLGANAGLVTGSWDPPFGSFLPGLSYQVRAEFFVPDACSTQADNTYANAGLCAGSTVVSARLRLFDGAADPGNFLESSANSFSFDMVPGVTPPTNGAFGVGQVRVQNGQVVGVAAGQMIGGSVTPVSPVGAIFAGVVPSALGNTFGLHFTEFGPVVTCFVCVGVGGSANPLNPNVLAGTADLTQVLTTFNNNGTARLVDPTSGRPLGVLLDSNGEFVRQVVTQFPDGTPVPEPGSLLLVLGALAAAAACLRRRNTR